MKRLLRWTIGITGSLLLLVAVLWSWSRIRGVPADAVAARGILQTPWQPQGRNAFPAVWLLRYDVPESAQDSLVAQDMARIRAWPEPAPQSAAVAIGEPASAAGVRYRDLSPTTQDLDMFCKPRESSCLQQVRADVPRYTALVARNERLLARISALSSYDFYKSGLPDRIDAPLPSFQLGRLLPTKHALDFARGDIDTAMGGVCRDLITWRRLGSKSDSLIMRMIGIAYSTDGEAKLLAEMFAGLPQDHPVPQICRDALLPAHPEELSMCRPMQGEFRYSEAAMKLVGSSPDPMSNSILYNAEMTIGDQALAFAPLCTQKELQAYTNDPAIRASPPSLGYLRLVCVSNVAGCILGDIARPSYSQYLLRSQDHGARLKVLATLLWLRDHPEDRRPIEERLAGRPPEFRSPTRDIELSDDGKSLRIRQFDAGRSEYWEIPLPSYLHDFS